MLVLGNGMDALPLELIKEVDTPAQMRNDDRSTDHQRHGERLEKLVAVNRTSKTVKGGKRFSFGALVVVGDKRAFKCSRYARVGLRQADSFRSWITRNYYLIIVDGSE